MPITNMLDLKNLGLLVFVFLISCGESYVPKPKGFNRIDLPDRQYVQLADTFPYTFEVSKHASIEPHRSAMAEPYWIDIKYFDLGGEIQLTYKSLKGKKDDLVSLIDDSYRLTTKHQVKATGIEQVKINIDSSTSATIFKLEGEVPSQMQFFATDSVENFIRGALYFKTSTKNDSLEPVIKYISEDIIHLVKSLQWKNPS